MDLLCSPRASGVLPLYMTRGNEELPSAGACWASDAPVAAATSTLLSWLFGCSPGSGLGGTIALTTLSWSFQPFFCWQVTIKTFGPGLGWPNRAPYGAVIYCTLLEPGQP
jgi:hypothetical protein